MKIKHTIIIFAFGYCFEYIGQLFRMLHYPNANILFVTGTLMKVTGILLFLFKLLTNSQLKKFLNS